MVDLDRDHQGVRPPPQAVRGVRAGVPRPPLAGALAAMVPVGLAVAASAAALPVAGRAPAVAAVVVFAAVAAVALRQLGGHHPHRRFGAANTVTVIRAGGVAVFAGIAVAPGFLAGEAAWLALAGALVLLALDGIDGWLARVQGVQSAYGARFDMEVDALLILVLAVIALALGKAGAWVLGLGLLRYGFVLAGLLWPVLARPLPASLRRKGVCVVQVGALTAMLAPAVTPPLSHALAASAFAALVWSFALDLRWLLARRVAP